jgi:hypothetical protein
MRTSAHGVIGAALAAACLLALPGSPSQAGSVKVQQLNAISSAFRVVMTCKIGTQSPNAPIYLFNTSPSRINEREPINWQTSGGAHGVVSLPFPLDPGKELRIAVAPPADSCSAWVDRRPVLQQMAPQQ